MSNYLESARILLNDRMPIYKTVAYSLLLFLTYYAYTLENMFGFYIMLVLTTMVYLGVFVTVLHNSINQDLRLIPEPDVFRLFGLGLKAFISILPYLIVGGLIANFSVGAIADLAKFEPLQQSILSGFIYIVFALFLFTPIIFFSKEFKMSETYNFKLIGKYFHEVLAQTVGFILFGIVLNLLILGIMGYFFWMLFGFENTFAYYICFVITLNFSVYACFLGQLHYELTAFDDKQD